MCKSVEKKENYAGQPERKKRSLVGRGGGRQTSSREKKLLKDLKRRKYALTLRKKRKNREIGGDSTREKRRALLKIHKWNQE